MSKKKQEKPSEGTLVYVAYYAEGEYHEGSTTTILGVYTTKELAEARCGEDGHKGCDYWEYHVEEFTLDTDEVSEGMSHE